MVNIRGEESNEDVLASFTEAELAEIKEMSEKPNVYSDLVREYLYSGKIPSMFPPCSLHVPSMFIQCSLNVPSMFPQCSLNVPSMFPQCFLNVPQCSLSVLCVCSEARCSLRVPSMCAAKLNDPSMFPEYSLSVP
jgi:hypothetical protein